VAGVAELAAVLELGTYPAVAAVAGVLEPFSMDTL